ncbi:hypothetical protein RHMOL_Rhmol09G0032500 [Rhododendron molle]|uniref:Uncharacterized protein n=1 Tax=Rhododendron molle TaxID=49168 RepID=A0ACC0MAG3_RHOML|nr:hypothetical protein RHMOL_Rhmol09G0032500 [Rhododendron molle]
MPDSKRYKRGTRRQKPLDFEAVRFLPTRTRCRGLQRETGRRNARPLSNALATKKDEPRPSRPNGGRRRPRDAGMRAVLLQPRTGIRVVRWRLSTSTFSLSLSWCPRRSHRTHPRNRLHSRRRRFHRCFQWD